MSEDTGELLDFSPEDVKRTVLLEPDWYPFRVRGYDTQFSKDKHKKMRVYELVGVGEGPHKDVVIKKFFLDDQRFRMIPFLNAVGAGIDDKGKGQVDPSRAKGKVLEVYVGRREDNGVEYNDPKQYRPYSGPAIAEAVE